MKTTFSSTGKAKIRGDDLRLIADLARKASRKLSYLGLPSPWMGDILAWKPFLGKVFAVESQKAYLTHLMDKAYTLGLIEQIVYYWGDIDAISESQVDQYDRSMADVFPVDLINLDYCRGLDYHSFSKLSTVEALLLSQQRSLLHGRQSRRFPYFLLFLTHNLPSHEGDPAAKLKYLDFLARDLQYYEAIYQQQLQNSLDWYRSPTCPTAYPHKCFVMGKLFECAHRLGFKAKPHRITQYFGDKDAIMIHYQFQITPINLRSPVPIDNRMHLADILNYPVYDEKEEEITPTRPKIGGMV